MQLLSKLLKWGSSYLRLLIAKAALGRKLAISQKWLSRGGKPLYIGNGARIRIAKGASVYVGSGVYLSEGCLLQALPGAKIVIEDNVFLNANTRIVASESVTIGAETMFGPNCAVYDHDHVFDMNGVHPELIAKPVVIGARTWIAANCLITKGVTIADCCLVAGGSVVTKSLDSKGIYGGAPAQFLKAI